MNCPACQEPLDRDDRHPEWVCKNRHRTVRTVTVGRFNGRCPDRSDRHHQEPVKQVRHDDPTVWWCAEGHYLVLDEPRTIQHLSPSSLATARDCMRRFEQAQVYGRREAPKWETEVGKFAHKVLEVTAEQPDGQRSFDEAKKLAAPAWLGYAAGWEYQALQLPKEEEKRFKWEAVNAVEVSLLAHPLNGRTVLATEQRFEKLDLNGTPMTGQIDLTLLAEPDEEPDLDVLVVDHKTGKFPSSSLATWQPDWPFKLDRHLKQVTMVAKDQRKKLVQAHVYIAATRKLTGADRVGARLDFVKPGDDGVLWADPSETNEVMREVRQTWRAVQAHQEAGQFPTETSGLCGWCPYLAWDNGDGTFDFCASGVAYTRRRMAGPYGWTKFGTKDPDSVPAVVTIRGLSEDQRRVAYALADAVSPLEGAAA